MVVKDSETSVAAAQQPPFLHDVPVNRVTARVFESNDPARGLVESLGFAHEGCLRNHVLHEGAYRDLHYYGLLAAEWRANWPDSDAGGAR